MRLLVSFVFSSVFFANIVLSSIHVAVKEESGYCVILNASKITGSIQYNNLQNEPATYQFEVNETSIEYSGKCHHPSNTTDQITLSFLPNGAPAPSAKWILQIFFSNNPVSFKAETFASIDYSLEVNFSPMLNSSVATHTYHNDVMPYEMQTVIPGSAYSCSSTSLKLGADSSLTFSDLKVIANTNAQNDTMEGLSVEKCSVDNVPESGSSVVLIVCVVFAMLIVLGALGGLAFYIKRTRMNH